MTQSNPDRSEALAKLWSLIKGIKVAMLTSWDGQRMRARPMQGFQDIFEGELRFYTKGHGKKVDEVTSYDQVCLAYADHDEQVYVSVAGKARLTRDRALLEKHWNRHVAAWFPQGLDEPDLAMIVVEVEEAEFWDSTSSSMKYLWEVTKANLTRSTPDVGDNQRVVVQPAPGHLEGPVRT